MISLTFLQLIQCWMCSTSSDTLSALGSLRSHSHYCRDQIYALQLVMCLGSCNLSVQVFGPVAVCNDYSHNFSIMTSLSVTHVSGNIRLCSHLSASIILPSCSCSAWVFRLFAVLNYFALLRSHSPLSHRSWNGMQVKWNAFTLAIKVRGKQQGSLQGRATLQHVPLHWYEQWQLVRKVNDIMLMSIMYWHLQKYKIKMCLCCLDIVRGDIHHFSIPGHKDHCTLTLIISCIQFSNNWWYRWAVGSLW